MPSPRARAATATAAAAGALLLVAAAPPAQAHPESHGLRTVVSLDGPRGVASLGHGRTLVTEADGSFSVVVERRHHAAVKHQLGSVPAGFIAPAIDSGRHGTVYILTPGGEPGQAPTGSQAKLYKWRPGWAEPRVLADIGAYQATDPDPYDLESFPEDSNPFGLAALRDGSVLVSDAAGNDLLRVSRHGHITTIARLKPRTVAVPEGFTDPPAGTMIPSEAVATSVTVGADGYYYVGELRGFPATPGTSQIWRINPHAVGALCDPEHPYRGSCRRYADGLTSIVDLGADRRGNIYAVSLSKLSWLALESDPPVPGSEIGALYQISRRVHHHHVHGGRIHELAKDKLMSPGGVDAAPNGTLYLTGPVFGPGGLMKLAR